MKDYKFNFNLYFMSKQYKRILLGIDRARDIQAGSRVEWNGFQRTTVYKIVFQSKINSIIYRTIEWNRWKFINSFQIGLLSKLDPEENILLLRIHYKGYTIHCITIKMMKELVVMKLTFGNKMADGFNWLDFINEN